MNVLPTELEEVFVIEPRVFNDKRGFFFETYQRERYAEFGIKPDFVQDNCSYSVQGTLRGLHYQHPRPQDKLVQVLQGEIYDIALDIRRGSPTFGQWAGAYLSDQNKRQLYIPEGFAHGFYVRSDIAYFAYKCTDYYHPESERGIIWNDPVLNIQWGCKEPLISEKDGLFPSISSINYKDFPAY